MYQSVTRLQNNGKFNYFYHFSIFYLFVSEEARDMAWKQCMNGADANQVDQLGLTGSESRGVAVTFGPTRLNLIETAAAAQNVNNE